MTTSIATPSISVQELVSMLESPDPVTVLDIRSREDRASWSIPGSMHVDAGDPLRAGEPGVLDQLVLPAGVPVVAVCAAGNTSAIATEQLRARGIEAYSLTGGMNAWSLAWDAVEVPLPQADFTLLQVRRLGKGCLSYLVASGDEAAVIDPSIETDAYIQVAEQHGWTITWVLETHIHADHLSRARALADKTGATLGLPPQRRVSFPFQPIEPGERIRIGEVGLEAISTPGHTLESTSYRFGDQALFTGDTLFLTSVGRPDLEANAAEARKRAAFLYRSLGHLSSLPGTLLVLPGHADAIALDNRPIVRSLSDVLPTLDLLRLSETAFVDEVLARIPPTPPNHHEIVHHNEQGDPPVDDPASLEAGANRCAIA
ncbi:MAG TPA: MBL fold metallo-hydrolase [Thermomicrobiales bacterium]|nr:MBL fold metallo-hydrolase [Thermomicrobiales bacterium]